MPSSKENIMTKYVMETLRSSHARNHFHLISACGPAKVFFVPLLEYVEQSLVELEARVAPKQSRANRMTQSNQERCSVAIWLECRCIDPVLDYLAAVLKNAREKSVGRRCYTTHSELGLTAKTAASKFALLAARLEKWKLPKLKSDEDPNAFFYQVRAKLTCRLWQLRAQSAEIADKDGHARHLAEDVIAHNKQR